MIRLRHWVVLALRENVSMCHGMKRIVALYRKGGNDRGFSGVCCMVRYVDWNLPSESMLDEII